MKCADKCLFEEAILFRLPISFWREWEDGKRDHGELTCLVIGYYKVKLSRLEIVWPVWPKSATSLILGSVRYSSTGKGLLFRTGCLAADFVF